MQILSYFRCHIMRFVNRTGNTHRLPEIGRNIPFLDEQEQEIDTDSILRSEKFQKLCRLGDFKITFANNSRIEQNLLRLQVESVRFDDIDGEIKLLFKGHFGGPTGFAKANRNILYGMARCGIDVAILPAQGLDGVSPSEHAALMRFQKLPHPKSICLHSTIPTFAEKANARYSILYTTTEAASVPKQFIEACDVYDEVWVVSDFCRDVYVSAGLKKPIFVIPNAVDNRNYHTGAKPVPTRPPLKPFRFVNVASWNYRKGYDALLRAYLTEFNTDDPVSLLFVTKYNMDHEGNRTKEIDKEIREFIAKYGGKHPPHIARCGIDITEEDMPGVYRYCHSLVLPSRGEGFGLPYLEASLCGLPVIGTRYSGQTMFLNDDNSYLLDIDSMAPAEKTLVHYWDGQPFPELKSEETIDKLGKLMREVFTNYDEAKKKNTLLQQEAVQNYSCDAVGRVAKDRLAEIWHRLS